MSLKMPEKISTALTDYTPKRSIGEGGSGRVYLVEDTRGDEFAIKCLFPELVSTEKRGRFRNELNFVRRNTHPNIVSLVDYGSLDIDGIEVPFFVMKYYPGTLRNFISLEEKEPEIALRYFFYLLDGIEVAHQLDIWHRDLKPENILIDPVKSELVITDFGIAHFSRDELFTTVETKKSDRLANFQYAAPEQKNRKGNVDQRADMYSLGLILNEMFTGEVPQGSQYMQISQNFPGYAFLDNIVEKMIAQSPKKRPSSINEIRLEIRLAQQQLGLSASEKLKPEADIHVINRPYEYKAEVDIAGRIEDVEHNSVFSISAGLSHSILIPPKEKKEAIQIISERYPAWGDTRKRVCLYSILLFLLIKDQISKLDIVEIDNEYIGYEPEIKGLLMQLLRATGLQVNKKQIEFMKLARNSQARQMASRVFQEKARPDQIISSKQISDLL